MRSVTRSARGSTSSTSNFPSSFSFIMAAACERGQRKQRRYDNANPFKIGDNDYTFYSNTEGQAHGQVQVVLQSLGLGHGYHVRTILIISCFLIWIAKFPKCCWNEQGQGTRTRVLRTIMPCWKCEITSYRSRTFAMAESENDHWCSYLLSSFAVKTILFDSDDDSKPIPTLQRFQQFHDHPLHGLPASHSPIMRDD